MGSQPARTHQEAFVDKRHEQALGQPPCASNGALPPELASEVRRILAAILVASYRADQEQLADSTVTPVKARNTLSEDR